MHTPHDIHSWSKQYREERLEEARVWHLLGRARASREPRGLRHVGLTWRHSLARLRGVAASG
jgi:hypothetical protein